MVERTSPRLFIFGAGGAATELLENGVVESLDITLVEDNPTKSTLSVVGKNGVFNYPVLGSDDIDVMFFDTFFVSAFNAKFKKKVHEKYKDHRFHNFFHPSCEFIVKKPFRSVGVWLGYGTHIAGNAFIGNLVRVNYGAIITHDCSVGDYSFIGINASLCSHSSVGVGSFIGSGSVLIENVKVGSNTVIGAGSVVTRDIPDNVVAYGNPCKVVRAND